MSRDRASGGRPSQATVPPSKSVQARNPQACWLFRFNAVLVGAFAVAFVAWFYVHIRPYFRQTLFFGVPLTLWSLWKLIASVLPKFVPDEHLVATLGLARTRTTHFLLFALAVLGVFAITTTSVYVEYDPNTAGETIEYEIQVSCDDRPYMNPLRVSSYDRIQGRPFFFWWPPRSTQRLRFHITRPLGYVPTDATLGVRSRVYLRIPGGGFQKQDVHIIRLLPGGALLQKPPRVDDVDESTTSLVISIGEKEHRKEYRVDDVMLETVCFGASEAVIRAALDQEAAADRFNRIRNYLSMVDWGEASEETARRVREKAEILSSSCRIVDTIALDPNSSVAVHLVAAGDPCSVDAAGQRSLRVPVRQRPGICNVPMVFRDD